MPTDEPSSEEESATPERSGATDASNETSAEAPDSTDDEDSERVGPMLAVGIFTALGFELAAFVFVGLFVGNWIDQKAGTSPAFMLVFVITACFAAGWHIYRIAERYL